MQATATAKVLAPTEGQVAQLGGIGARLMVNGTESGGGFSLVEHPMAPRALGAPMHRHTREDEYSYVLEGRVAVQLGEEIVYGTPGDLIFKPRGQWHTFWTAGDEPARILEIISPAGFESYFERLGALLAPGSPPDPAALQAVAAEHELEVDLASIPRLMEQHGLR